MTILGPGQSTPAPWINVIANPTFGFQISAEGSGYTWAVNSRENQITPWSNDPVADRPGEAFYVRDDDTGELWSPTALPIRDEAATYIARHGRGYSRFEHTSQEIAAESAQFVPHRRRRSRFPGSCCTIGRTASGVSRVTAYAEWVLGSSRGASLPFVITEIDSATSRHVRSKSLEHGVWITRRIHGFAWSSDRLDGRSSRVHRTQWNAGESRGVRRRGAILEHGRGRPRSLRRHAHEDRVVTEWRGRDRLLPRTSRGRRRGAQSDHLVPRRRS